MQPYISALAPSIMGPVGEADRPIVFWDDFLTYDTSAWVETLSSSNTIDVAETGVGGEIHFDMGAGGLCGIQLQNAGFTCAADKTAVFEARFRPTDVSGTKLVTGLCTIDTDLIGGVTDHIGFLVTDGAASTKVVCVSGSETTTTTVDIADATNMKVRCVVTGLSKVVFYIDDAKVATHTTVPTGAMTPSFEHTALAASDDAHLDYILAVMTR